MANEQQQEQKRTASQRIDDLERGLMAMYQTADSMARDMQVAKDAIKLLGNKLDSVVKLLNRDVSEKINDLAVGQVMIQNNVDELKGKVTDLVGQGILVASEEVTDSSFIVGQEIDDAGGIVNPRLQFALGALSEDLKTKIKASKVGETVVLQEGKLQFKLLEVYSIQQPTAPAQEAAPVAEASAPATETAPAADSAPAVQADAQSSNNDASAQSAPAQSVSGS